MRTVLRLAAIIGGPATTKGSAAAINGIAMKGKQ
jgi:hypothetical protein